MTDDAIQTSVRLSPQNHEWLRRTAYDRSLPGQKISQNQILNDLIDNARNGGHCQ